MRLNKFIALSTGMSRRAADDAIAEQKVTINGEPAQLGARIQSTDLITLDGRVIAEQPLQTILLNKPVGYVCSRDGQGSKTVYELLPDELGHLKPVGRLDKDSSGLLLMTNDGTLAQKLTHPSSQKRKVYEITLDKPLPAHEQKVLTTSGVKLDDGQSTFDELTALDKDRLRWTVTIHEGRNRQIRRTFGVLDYKVVNLHRTTFGEHELADVASGEYTTVK